MSMFQGAPLWLLVAPLFLGAAIACAVSFGLGVLLGWWLF